MRFAENPEKTRNLVHGAGDLLRDLYAPVIERFESTESAMSMDIVRSRVRHSSLVQAVSGLISVGPTKSALYVLRKMRKRFQTK